MPYRHSVFLGLASGLLLVLSLPKPNLYALAWIALVPLFIAITKSQSTSQAGVAAYASGLVYFGGTCYWITDTMVIYGGLGTAAAAGVAVLFVVVLGLYFAAFGAALHYFVRRWGPNALLLAPSLWVGMELVRTYVPFGGFPWMLSGYALVPYGGVLQIVAWTGIYGLSFVATAVSSLFAIGVGLGHRGWLVPGIAAVAISWSLPVPPPPDAEPGLEVRIVQTNLAFEQVWDRPTFEGLLDEFAGLSKAPAPDPAVPHLIVWPEASGPFYLEENGWFRERVQRIAQENKAYVVLGYVGASGDLVANSAGLLDPQGSVLSRYDKIHLVPFGEYVPLRSALFFAESLLAEVGNFAAGTQYTISPLDNHLVSTAICYESIFPGLIREFVRRGSELIVVITNDAWFGESSAPHQHLRMAVVRAVENRRYVVRAANTGISAIIDPFGRILGQTKMYERTAISGLVRFRTGNTFYTKYGDVFAYLNVVVVIGWWVAAFLSGCRRGL